MVLGAREWAGSLYETLNGELGTAKKLRDAAIAGDLSRWTQALTNLMAESLRRLELDVAGKGHRCTTLPVAREEYLAIDVAAFERTGDSWRYPVAVCELENSTREDVVAYALWKVLCIRDSLRVVFCYRSARTDGTRLVAALADRVVRAMAPDDRQRLTGDTVVFVGSRNESTTFPYGFFQAWRLNRNLGRFETFRWQE